MCTVATIILATVFSITSCEKENTMKEPASGSQTLQKALLKKTQGGKQALPHYFAIAPGENNPNKTANSVVFPRNAMMFGSSYAVWSGKWWKWALELPAVSNHPFNDDPAFDVAMGQAGNVWFLTAPFGTVVRNCTVPADKAFFIGILNAEASDLEGLGDTYAERVATANFLADHIVPSSLFATVDGININATSYRFLSPQFSFYAPTPWIFGDDGGLGTSVSDGYFLMVKKFDSGTSHTIHVGGAFHFAVSEGDPFDFDASLDVTYNITVL